MNKITVPSDDLEKPEADAEKFRTNADEQAAMFTARQPPPHRRNNHGSH